MGMVLTLALCACGGNGGGGSMTNTDLNTVFATNRDGNFEIYIAGADGSTPTRLTTNTDLDLNPALSPDKTKIVCKRSGHLTRI